jgi:hypothetical protein
MSFASIARLSPTELAGRLRQEQQKLLERMRIVSPGGLGPTTLCGSLRQCALGETARGHVERGDLDAATAMLRVRFAEVARATFFLGAVESVTPALISERMPDAREAVLRAAQRSLAGRFDLLGYSDLRFGVPMNWHRDPLSGLGAAAAQHWSRIDPLDRARVGDHKIVWELNRHQWLLHWAQAYAFTGDERYAERTVRVLEEWLGANPPGIGVNWVSSLELAIRIVSWCWALVLLRESRALRPASFVRVVGALHAHATHVARYLSTTYSPNTHLLGEALGLLYAGVLFPDMQEADSWRRTAQRILVEQAGRQILPDGVCFEQSTCYQRYTAEVYMHFVALARRNELEVPTAVTARVQASVDFLLAISRSGGSAPQIGDGDGGWLLPLLPREADDMRGVFATAAALFGRSDCAVAAGGPTLEAAWLLGEPGLQAIEALRSVPCRAPISRLFEAGGYAVLRSGPDASAHRMIVDVGPLGCPISGAHGHADLLALTCDIFGEPCIVDPGMPTYGGDPAWRDAFRSTALHSTVMLDRRSQAEPSGTFSWKSRPHARLRSWLSNDDFDFVDAEHDAYGAGRGAMTHRRRVIFVKPRYWVMVDDLDESVSSGAHRIEVCFQFAPRHTIWREGSWVRATTQAGHALFVRTTAAVALQMQVHEGDEGSVPLRGWYSSAYGRVEPAPALVFSTHARLPLRLVTVLHPARRGEVQAPKAFPPDSDASLLQRLST